MHACCVQARSKSPAVHNPQPYPQPFFTSFTPTVSYETNTNVDYRITENESGPESDYRNVWDPWDEYEQKTVLPSTELITPQLIPESITNINSGLRESHNTNAHSVLPPPFPQSNRPAISTFHHQIDLQTNNSIEIVETPPTLSQPEPLSQTTLPPLSQSLPQPQPPPQIPPPTPQLEIVYIPVESQYSHTNNNNPPAVNPPRIPTPPVAHVPSNHQFYAQPHEFEPPCTVANESILHPNDNGSHDNDGDVSTSSCLTRLYIVKLSL